MEATLTAMHYIHIYKPYRAAHMQITQKYTFHTSIHKVLNAVIYNLVKCTFTQKNLSVGNLFDLAK